MAATVLLEGFCHARPGYGTTEYAACGGIALILLFCRLSAIRLEAHIMPATRPLRLRFRKMVGWYDPTQLIRTGIEVIISTLFARHSDGRRIDAIATPEEKGLDYRDEKYLDPNGRFWFDFTADCGDGWHSTYSVAYYITRPLLDLQSVHLARGRLLILGGDLVYPTPSQTEYDARLVAPYTIGTCSQGDHEADVLAIPGNHDWYDSLVAFRRIFCCGRKFASFNTRQTRSYFSARLPAGWWLLGIDTQLDHDIDELQFKYFLAVVANIPFNDKVILCCAEPTWIVNAKPNEDLLSFTKPLLDQLEAILDSRLVLSLAGDIHHYRRHSNKSGRHRITCGTGGAFLHPTHEISSNAVEGYICEKSFPSIEESRRITFHNLLFMFKNPKFGLVSGFAYLIVAWENGLYVGEDFQAVSIKDIGQMGLRQFPDAVVAAVHSALLSPVGFTFYLILITGFIFFADRSSKYFRWVGGTVHAMTHVVAGFFIYWLAAYFPVTILGLPHKSIPQYLIAGSILFTLGWVAGSVILGIYLLISFNVFGKHWNEAFSSLQIQDWKGFVRGFIGKDGCLNLFFVGIKRVPRRWKAEGAILKPFDKKHTEPVIVDHIKIP
jgi:hypothetical protein